MELLKNWKNGVLTPQQAKKSESWEWAKYYLEDTRPAIVSKYILDRGIYGLMPYAILYCGVTIFVD